MVKPTETATGAATLMAALETTDSSLVAIHVIAETDLYISRSRH